MRIKTKMLKRLIAVLCAATMVASGAVVSVGAVNETDINAALKQVEVVDAQIEILKKQKKEIEDKIGASINELEKQIEEDTEAFYKLMNKIVDANKRNEDYEKRWQELNERIQKNEEKKQEYSKQKYSEISNIEAEIKNTEEEKTKLEEQVNNLLEQAEKEELAKLESERQEKNENKEEMKKSDGIFSHVDANIINSSNMFKSFGNRDNDSEKEPPTDIKSGVLMSFAQKYEEPKSEIDKNLKINESININLSGITIYNNICINERKSGNGKVSINNEGQDDLGKRFEDYNCDDEGREPGSMIKLPQGIGINLLKPSVVESEQDSNNVNNKDKKEAAEKLGNVLENIFYEHKKATWNAIDRTVKERLEELKRLEKERQRKIKKQENKEMTKEELQKAREDAQTRLSKYYFAAKRELDESLIKDTEDWKKADDGIYSTLNNAIRQIIYTYSIQEDINKEIDLAERTVKDMMNKCRQQEKQKLKREIEELEKNITLLRRERDEKHEKTRQARQEFGIWNRPKEERKQCEYNLGEAEAQERKAQRALEDALTTQAHKIEKLQKVEKKLMSDEERKKMEEEIAKDIERMRKEEQERKKQQKLEEEKQERERLEAEKWVDNSVEQVKQERLKKEKNTKTEVRVNKSTLEEVQQERITREKNQIIKRTPEEKYIRAEDMKAAYALIEHRHETAKIEKDFKAVEKLAEEKFDQERKELCQPFIAKKDSLSNEYRKKHGIKYQEYIERYNEIEKEEKEAETEAYKKYQKILKIIQIKCREMICKSYERYEKFCKEMGRTSVEL